MLRADSIVLRHFSFLYISGSVSVLEHRNSDGKCIELVKILKNRKITTCAQETRWVGSKTRDVIGYKL